jgi:hypothetical protein
MFSTLDAYSLRQIGDHFGEELSGIKFHRASDGVKLKNVQSPNTAFVLRDPRLWLVEPSREIGLRQAGILARVYQRPNERLIGL